MLVANGFMLPNWGTVKGTPSALADTEKPPDVSEEFADLGDGDAAHQDSTGVERPMEV